MSKRNKDWISACGSVLDGERESHNDQESGYILAMLAYYIIMNEPPDYYRGFLNSGREYQLYLRNFPINLLPFSIKNGPIRLLTASPSALELDPFVVQDIFCVLANV